MSAEGDEAKIEWRCPKCGADANEHGKGECISRQSSCMGFICECEGDSGDDHGTEKEICPHANCYHCGWGGKFPTGMVNCPTCKGVGKVKAKKAKAKP